MPTCCTSSLNALVAVAVNAITLTSLSYEAHHHGEESSYNSPMPSSLNVDGLSIVEKRGKIGVVTPTSSCTLLAEGGL